MTPRRVTVLSVLLAVVAMLLAGCASVPSSSPVQVLRQMNGSEAEPPPAPKPDADTTDLVRGFIDALASSADKHAAARRFLTAEAAASWDDTVSLIVVGNGPTVSTEYVSADSVRITISGTTEGVIDPQGAFQPSTLPFERVVDLVRRDGQWRISQLPAGVFVESTSFARNYRRTGVWFVDVARRKVVSEPRYLAQEPRSTQPARLMEMLLEGPSSAVAGAVSTELPPGVTLRSNVAPSPDATVTVDLKGLGPLDDTTRGLLAAQVVLTLVGPEVDSVDLQVNGAPMDPVITRWSRSDVESAIGEAQIADGAPTLVTSGGRIGQLTGTVSPPVLLPGPVGDGRVDVLSAAVSNDGSALAVLAGGGRGQQLSIGTISDGVVAPAPVSATTMTRPTWSPAGDEVWTVLDGSSITRVRLDKGGGPPVADTVDPGSLRSFAPITTLRLSRDGVRVLAVAGGALYVGAVQRGLKDAVKIVDVRQVAMSAGPLTSADWRDTDSIMALTSSSDLYSLKVDGTGVEQQQSNKLLDITAVAAARTEQPVLVANPVGVWSFTAGSPNYWKQVPNSPGNAIPVYPG